MQLSEEGKQCVDRALTERSWTLHKLAEESGFSISTVKKFSSCKNIRDINFVSLCKLLAVDWHNVLAESNASDKQNTSSDLASSQKSQDLIRRVQNHCQQKVRQQHTRMRLLNGEEIDVEQLYVDVWLLAKPENKYFNSSQSLLDSFDIENDRLALGKRLKRNPGLEIANAKNKLVILGKPGSGKTTFLKRLAVDWCNQKFQPGLVVVLIELRRIRDEAWDLLVAIDKELGLANWKQAEDCLNKISKLKDQRLDLEKHREIDDLQQEVDGLMKHVKHLLKKSKLIIFMDGLDEVPTNQLRQNVQEQLRKISLDFPDNRFILTCRTQIIKVIPDGFTSVEVADFTIQQVDKFVQNWFRTSGLSQNKVEEEFNRFKNAIYSKPSLRELTGTPILLNLMCLVFLDEGKMPSNRSEIYEKGIRLLLNRWNSQKQISDWEIGTETYRELSLEDKEQLLVEIAARKFFTFNDENSILFEQKRLSSQIARHLQLNNHREGLSVLKSIEAQHGLLVERADELWSFSHLTFQEHFAVQWLLTLPSQELANKVSSPQWQEVIVQLVKSQQHADRLLWCLKNAVDQSIASDSRLQDFLQWLFQKTASITTKCKVSSIRAFYYSLAYDLSCDSSVMRANVRARARKHNLNLILDQGFDVAYALDSDYSLAYSFDDTLEKSIESNLNLNFDRSLARILSRARALGDASNISRDTDRAMARNLDYCLNYVLSRAKVYSYVPDSILNIQRLRTMLPNSGDWLSFSRWWKINGVNWTNDFRKVMIEYHNIGHNWDFSLEKRRRLDGYCSANNFLVKLIRIEGGVSQQTRISIEESLFLPFVEDENLFG